MVNHLFLNAHIEVTVHKCFKKIFSFLKRIDENKSHHTNHFDSDNIYEYLFMKVIDKPCKFLTSYEFYIFVDCNYRYPFFKL